MKKPDKIIFERYLYKLSLDELRAYIQRYDEKNKTRAYQEITKVKQAEIQTKIEALYPNITCPYCKSDHYVKNGFYDGFQRYKCKNCNSSFTLVTDTFMEGTNWTWEVWVKLLQMTLCSMSLDEMIDTLEKDYKLVGISRNTVFLARHKLLHAMSLMPKPTLTGIVQVDETFFRENQKGTRTDLGKKLINVIPNIVPIRLPRRGYSPSRLGTMGTEYATAVCAVDNHNHAVTVVAGFGKIDPKVFTDCFDNHFADITYLCTDGSPIYKDYCVLKSIPHYVKPANFVKRKYIKETPKGKLKEIAKEYKIKNYTSMTHWQLYSAIMDLPKAERTKIIQKLIANDKVYNIYTEDIKFITAHELSSDDLTYSKGGNLVDLDRLFIIEKED